MIRILHSVSNMDRAGAETMLMNYYRHIDRDKFQFDFLCNKSKIGAYEPEIEKMGGRIFRTPGLNPLCYPKYLSYMSDLFTCHPEYKILHAHNGQLSVYALHAAKLNNIPVRISHAHGSSIVKDKKYLLKLFCGSRLSHNLTHRFACSTEAAACYFKPGTPFVQINNAIEPKKFAFSQKKREEMRVREKVTDKFVIGHVGNFVPQKNHPFLIKVFAEVKKLHPNSTLYLLGDGFLQNSVHELVAEMGLSASVRFTGNVSNAQEWYQMFDVFTLPSTSEGLPVVSVEAQAAGLPCLISDSVTKECSVSSLCNFLSLEKGPEAWAKALLNLAQNQTPRTDMTQTIRENGYDIEFEAKKLQELYLSYL